MQVFTEVSELRNYLQNLSSRGKKVGFVPTMGFLHDGHLSLIELSKSQSDITVVSIFVNPKQFNDAMDYQRYPRDLSSDIEKAKDAGADIVFAPSEEEVYSAESGVELKAGSLARGYEGEFRPGHFDGVVTVVARLFQIVNPDISVFGEKDFQQLAVIRQLVEELELDIDIVAAPIIREQDGLALSSRNVLLSEESRSRALSLSKGLFKAKELLSKGERNASVLCAVVEDTCKVYDGVEVEYIALVDSTTLAKVEKVTSSCRILVAANVGDVRLIDNIELRP